MKVYKKALAGLLMVCMLMLSACSLAPPPNNQKPEELKFKDDFFCGYFLSFKQNGGTVSFPTEDFESEDAVALYVTKIYDENNENPYIEIVQKGVDFVDGKVALQNSVFESGGKIDIEKKLYFTYEMLGAISYKQNIYYNAQKKSLSLSPDKGYSFTGDTLIETQQIQKENRALPDGTIEEITFESKFKLHMMLVDNLTGVEILEYNQENNMLQKTSFDMNQLLGTDGKIIYSPTQNCDYIVIAENYEVMEASNNYNVGDTYTKRHILNKQSKPQTHLVNAPRGSGFTKAVYVEVEY